MEVVIVCTALTYQTRDHYFGRTLDISSGYQEAVTVVPRHFPLAFRQMGALGKHYAMVGVAYPAGGYPLYYDAVNEKGLAMAGLRFPGNACYRPSAPGRDNVTPFELIPWLLGQCADLRQARCLLEQINLLALDFSSELPLSPLHWFLADRQGALAVEPLAEGLRIWEDPAGVLTNNPPFDFQMRHLARFRHLSRETPENRLAPELDLVPDSLGTGALGLPGDNSSPSRFVRAVFARCHAVSGPGEAESVSQVFHILGTVAQVRGCVRAEEGYEHTLYTACCNLDQGLYYYTTYENSRVTCVDLRREDLDEERLRVYPLLRQPGVLFQN